MGVQLEADQAVYIVVIAEALVDQKRNQHGIYGLKLNIK